MDRINREKRVLLIEDSAIHRPYMIPALQEGGVRLLAPDLHQTKVPDLFRAIRIWEERGQIGAVIADWNLTIGYIRCAEDIGINQRHFTLPEFYHTVRKECGLTMGTSEIPLIIHTSDYGEAYTDWMKMDNALKKMRLQKTMIFLHRDHMSTSIMEVLPDSVRQNLI